jgi:hypothetical protein
MASPTDPYLRAALYPFPDYWAAGPGVSFPVVRFGLWAGRRLAPGTSTLPGIENAIRFAALAPELPFSVLPFSLRHSAGLHCDALAAEGWRGSPLPTWRGVPCRFGTALITLSNTREPGSVALPILVLLPERDPAGPPSEMAFLGMEFLVHYDVQVTLTYSALRYAPAGEGRRQLDRSVPAGFLEIT